MKNPSSDVVWIGIKAFSLPQVLSWISDMTELASAMYLFCLKKFDFGLQQVNLSRTEGSFSVMPVIEQVSKAWG